jgi:hypothetical protein
MIWNSQKPRTGSAGRCWQAFSNTFLGFFMGFVDDSMPWRFDVGLWIEGDDKSYPKMEIWKVVQKMEQLTDYGTESPSKYP